MYVTQLGQCSKIMLVVVATLFIHSISIGAESANNKVLAFNTADTAPYSNHDGSGIYDRIIMKICQISGVDVNINHLPSARSIENVDIGFDDGEYARIKGLSEKYPNIRVVDEKLIDFAFTAFSNDSNMVIEDWSSLKNYNVAFLKGWKIYEVNVTDVKSIQMSSSEAELFNLLQNRRVDVILYERLRGLDYMYRNNIKGIVPIAKPLSVRGMYLYVNKKHEILIPQLEDALKTLKASGEYADIVNSFVREY